jgi:hypothetical protein
MDGINMHRNKEPTKKALRYLNSLYMGDGQYIITSFPPKKNRYFNKKNRRFKKSPLF